MNLDQALAALETQLSTLVASDIPLLTEASRHMFSAGGKRLRPRLALLAYDAAGGRDLEAALPLATAIEIIHTATLIHDDINDHSDLRRNRPTINALWGTTIALLTGDFLFTKAYQLMATYPPQLNAALADACVALVEGETLQVETAKSATLDRDTYIRIISKKTASLFAAAARLGALQAGADEAVVAALDTYGHNVGLAFQIVDDVLDIVGDPAALGKPVHADMPQGKLSLPLLNVAPAMRETVSALAERLIQDGAIDEALAQAHTYTDRAIAALDALPPSSARDALAMLARSAIERSR
jgi:geranylgeranyl pyrophosphate synthase